jgi:hypothetical protein
MAPVIMGNADRPELGAELTASFCRTDPEIAKRFARATFAETVTAMAAFLNKISHPGAQGSPRVP